METWTLYVDREIDVWSSREIYNKWMLFDYLVRRAYEKSETHEEFIEMKEIATKRIFD
jgi:hypothetical protein